ncbi:unnamed protein product [Ambrosiozyma monospora]|uniref:Unnamed protein product n=1 Tax=Ambrosiozyma monospora TaxID=43982 RepID=A0ACB5T431_AMBMO|nr:unnamed protein product [Ambrosiozyma monospora]
MLIHKFVGVKDEIDEIETGLLKFIRCNNHELSTAQRTIKESTKIEIYMQNKEVRPIDTSYPVFAGILISPVFLA